MPTAMNTIGRRQPWRFHRFRKTNGYANHPLDGVWLRAPYLHNGSVPTLRDLLEAPDAAPEGVLPRLRRLRPGARRFRRPTSPPRGERTFVEFDTTLGNGNGGHVYGIDLLRRRPAGAAGIPQDALAGRAGDESHVDQLPAVHIVVWLGVLANWAFAVWAIFFDTGKLLDFFGLGGVTSTIWVYNYSVLLIILSCFYIPAAHDPLRYQANAWLLVVGRLVPQHVLHRRLAGLHAGGLRQARHR